MLIGLGGFAQSGKDTAYRLIKEQYAHTERIAFADKMKDSICALFDISLEDIEDLKIDADSRVKLFDQHGGRGYCDISFREFIQRYGTEAHRNIFGDNFWVDITLPKNFDHKDRLVIITDVRFKSEADRIHELGGYIIEVIRPSIESKDTHISEQLDIYPDFKIYNESTLSNYKDHLLDIMDFIQ